MLSLYADLEHNEISLCTVPIHICTYLSTLLLIFFNIILCLLKYFWKFMLVLLKSYQGAFCFFPSAFYPACSFSFPSPGIPSSSQDEAFLLIEPKDAGKTIARILCLQVARHSQKYTIYRYSEIRSTTNLFQIIIQHIQLIIQIFQYVIKNLDKRNINNFEIENFSFIRVNFGENIYENFN